MRTLRRTLLFSVAIVLMAAGSWTGFRQAAAAQATKGSAVVQDRVAVKSSDGRLLPQVPAGVADPNLEANWTLFAWVCTGATLLTVTSFWITRRGPEQTIEKWKPD